MSAVSAVADCRYRSNFVIQCFRLIPSGLAARAGGVSAITAEQHAHVHFVGLALGPAEKTADAVPAVVVVIIVAAIAALLTVDDKVLIGLRQFLEGHVDIDLLTRAGA